MSAFIPRMTTENSSQSQNQSSDYTIAIDRLVHILAAGWHKSARTVDQPQRFEHAGVRREIFLVETYCREDTSFHLNIPFSKCFCPNRCRTMSATASMVSGSRARTTNTPHTPSCIEGSRCCTASRTNRFMRFLLVARLSTLADTITAN